MPSNNYIKDIRKTKDLTQSDLAERMGTTQETIQRLESGKRRLTYDWIKKLANALGVHPSEITEGPTTPIPQTAGEREMLNVFRELSESEQKTFATMLHTLRNKKTEK